MDILNILCSSTQIAESALAALHKSYDNNPPSVRTDKSLGFFPSWKTLALASLATTTRNGAGKRNPFYLPQPGLLLENTSSEINDEESFQFDNETEPHAYRKRPISVETVEAIENEVARAHDLLDLELSGHGFRRSPTASASMSGHRQGIFSHMPAGIRSAIVASAVIVITSLTTFMVIFVVCRWKQRKRRRTNYLRNYNAMKSKLPTIATTSHRSSLNNVEELIGDSVSPVVGCGGIASTTTATTTLMNQKLYRQNSFLFPRTSTNKATTIGMDRLNSDGLGNRSCSITGSTTSLALSIRSGLNGSTNKLNTLDPNSPEVQEYLFDTLRKSF